MKTSQIVLRNTSLNLLSGISQRIGQTVTFILIARILTSSSTGAFKLANSYTSILLTLSLWGLDQLLIRDVSKNRQEIQRYFSNFLILRLILSLLVWGSVWGVMPLLPYAAPTRSLILIFTATIIPSNLNNLLQSVWVVLEDMRVYSGITVIFSLIRLTTGVIALLVNGSLILIGWLFLIVGFFEMFINIWYVMRLPSFHPWQWQLDYSFWREHLNTATPLIVVSFILVVEYQFDDIILSFFWPENEVGIYGTAAMILSLLLFFTRSVQLAIFPVFSRAHSQSLAHLRHVYNKSIQLLFFGAFPIAFLISLYAPKIIRVVFGDSYQKAGGILRVLVWAFLISAFNVPNSRLLIVANKQRQMASFALISMTGNIFLSLWLVPRLGGVGTAWARVLAMPLYTLPALLYVQGKICKLGWRDIFRLNWRSLLS